jgi:cell fate (sporulation/competence/biofilm development) regulator YlbF (YheA/YmcA/DUF963 family)
VLIDILFKRNSLVLRLRPLLLSVSLLQRLHSLHWLCSRERQFSNSGFLLLLIPLKVENGWTSDDTAIEWLSKVFIPSTAPQDPQEPRLLVLDSHRSHETTEFIYKYFEHNLHLLHVLQPLDLSIFSPLKGAYQKELSYLSLLTDSTPIRKRNFLLCYQKAHKKSLTEQNIKVYMNSNNTMQLTLSDTIKEVTRASME